MRRYSAAMLLVIAAAVVSLSSCGFSGGDSAWARQGSGSLSSDESEGKIKVSVTFDAMREFTEAVGKNKVSISTIIPDGSEPHDFEPKAQDLVDLGKAQVFVYNGLGMETWVPDAVKSAGNPSLVAVEASQGVRAIRNTDPGEVKEHGQYDPHLWLSLKGAEAETKNIAEALVKADPANRQYYETNCSRYVSQLEKLYQDYQGKFRAAPRKSFVTGHAAFAYFCRDFGLQQNSVEDVFAEGEPGARQMAELIDYCRAHQVTTVFAEQMASPEVSDTLANEVGAKVETVYTMENTEDGKSYLERMDCNLSEILASLQ